MRIRVAVYYCKIGYKKISMKKLNFRYNDMYRVSIIKNTGVDILFYENDNLWPTYTYRFRPYIKEIIFNYQGFEVKCTSKDGSSYIAGCRKDTYYGFKKKKSKTSILFVKNKDYFAKFNVNVPGVKAMCLVDGKFTDDKTIIDDFVDRKEPKPFNEEKYLASLDEEDRLDYLEDKRIDIIVDSLSKKYELNDEQELSLYFYIKDCKDQATKEKMISGEIEISKDVILEHAKNRRNSKKEELSFGYEKKDLEFTIDNQYSFEKDDFFCLDLNIDYEYDFVDELYDFFIYEYEDRKEFFCNSIERIKKSIDELIPYFNEFVRIVNG